MPKLSTCSGGARPQQHAEGHRRNSRALLVNRLAALARERTTSHTTLHTATISTKLSVCVWLHEAESLQRPFSGAKNPLYI